MTREQIAAELTTLRERVAQLENELEALRREQNSPKSEEANYRSLFEETSDGIFFTSREGKILHCNQALADLLGYPLKDLMQSDVVEFYRDPADRVVYQEVVERDGRVKDYQAKLKRKDGTPVECSITATVRWDTGGKVMGYQGIVRDMTVRNRLEQELTSGREQLRVLIEDAPDGIYLTDLRGVFLEANRAAESLFGKERSHLLGNSVLKLSVVPAQQLPRAAKLLAENALGYPTGPDEFQLRTIDGKHVVAEIRTYPVTLQEQVLVLGLARDVTRRKAAEEALRESEEHFRAVAESAAEAVITANERGRIRFWNPAACDMFGYGEEEVLGVAMGILLSERLRGQHATDLGRIMSGGADHLCGRTVELHAIRKDGSEFPIELSLSSWYQGRQKCYTAIVRDISERKQAEGALELERAYFEGLFRGSPEGLVLLDSQSRVIRQNDEFTRMFGYEPEETAGRSLDKLLAPSDLRDEAASFTEQAVMGQRLSVETVRKAKDGRLIDVSVLVAPIEIEGRQVALIAVYRDITDRKRAEEVGIEMRKLDSLSVMAGGIAHDFNNLLVSMLGNAELALMDLEENNPVRDSLASIQKAAQRATDLTGQMLAYSGKGKFNVQPLDVSSLVEEMKRWLKTGPNDVANVRYDLATNPPKFLGDSAQIREVVSALFDNALEALEGRAGTVTISTGVEQFDRAFLSDAHLADGLEEGAYVSIRVADTGTGMDEATKKKIFDPFFSTRFTGRGLGLAATLGIVRGHGGTMHVDTDLGTGTTVTALFPISLNRQEGEEQSKAGRVEEWRGRGLILIVDDEDSVRSVTRAVLERWGFSVVGAADGQEGVEVFRERQEDISAVLLDYTMPQMNGDVTFLEMHKLNPRVPVILMSGYAEEDAIDTIPGEGLAGFLHKPFQPIALMQKLKEVLAS